MKTVKAILIDAKTKTVEYVNVRGLDDVRGRLGIDCFTTAGHRENEDYLFVDDEGMLKEPEVFFYCPLFYPIPLAGGGLITGTDQEGDVADVKTTIEELALKFMTLAEAMPYLRQAQDQVDQAKADTVGLPIHHIGPLDALESSGGDE